LAAIDVLVTATSARLAFLDRESIERLSRVPERPLLILDAGIPRNVDAAAGELPHVHLLNLDSLDREQEQALAARVAEVPRVEAILAEELDRWRQWCQRRSAGFGAEWKLPRKFGPAMLNPTGAGVPVPTAKG
jgi:glutamyl-tRNA reductase